MNRANSDFMVIITIVVLLALYCVTGWMAASPVPGRPFISGLLATLAVAFSALVLYFANDRAMNEMSFPIPVIFVLLATANPCTLYAAPIHAAAALLAASIFFLLGFSSVSPSPGPFSLTFISISAAGLFHPPLFWLIPVYAILAIVLFENKFKGWVTIIISVLLPPLVLAGIRYLGSGSNPAEELLSGIWARMTAIYLPKSNIHAATVLRIILTGVAAVFAIGHILRHLTTYKTSQFKAAVRIVILTLAITLVALLFMPEGGKTAGILAAMPLSLLLNEYFRQPRHSPEVKTMAIVLILILITERISYFV